MRHKLCMALFFTCNWGDGEGGEKSYCLVADKTTVVLVNATDLFVLLQVASFSCIY